MENSKEFADKLFGICRGRGTLSQMKALTRIGSERWNMNIDGMLTEDEVKMVATQMITEKTTAGPFDPPRDSKSSLVQFATTKIRGLVVCKGGYLRGGSHPDWNLISIYSPV
ncbi:uncharacterized protein LOC119315235 [Triticum dicoccoides]|uniref:uncharacterized protein LOC119315235 n=1 Tax=Triticum dicoccoides TaxID=85692 RepID=UPI00188FD3E8|nr:uncharacterized protein LOC119315235 [Triticum dicoccoides]